MKIHNILDDINCQAQAELTKAIAKHGEQLDISLAEQFLILSEEYGEVAMSLLDKDYANCKIEIAQVIAMCYRLYFLIENMEEKE
jgi:hypothetical protein